MKYILAMLLLLATACAPVSQTVTNVSRFVRGVQILQYQAASPELSAVITTTTMTMQMGGSYTPLAVSTDTTGKITLFSKPLKGSIARDTQAQEFSIDVTLVETSTYTEITFQLSDIDHPKAQEVINNLTAELDKQFVRYTVTP
jgi:hypothetical protein